MKKNILNELKKLTKRNYKSIRNSLFLSIYGKVKLSKNPPLTKIKIIKFNSKNDFSRYNYKFFEVENGRVFTDNTENVSIISGNILLDKFSFQQVKGKLVCSTKNQILRTGTPKLLKKIKGNIAVLAQGASGYNNYAHYLFDIMPKLKLLSLSTNLKKIDFFYFSKLNKYQKEILKFFDISERKILDSNKYRYVQSDKIIGVTHPNYTKGTISEAHSKMPAWIIYFLRKKFLKNRKHKKKFDKIFIDRSDSKLSHCKLINNNEVKSFLKLNGFKILKLSNLSFNEQINIFRDARVIVGPHGAGFANLVFCMKKTKVIEIIPTNHPNKVYQRISKINHLKYTKLKIRKINSNKNGDMFLKKVFFKKLLKF